MRILERFFNFYITSSLHVALACISLVYLSFLQVQVVPDVAFLWFSLGLAISGYNFVKYIPALIQHFHTDYYKRNRGILYFSMFVIILTSLLFLQLSFPKYYILFPFLLLTFMYVFPLSGTCKNLRTIPGIKIVIVAIVWVGITYIVPVFYMNVVTMLSFMEIFQRFLLILILMIPFEIRDLSEDQEFLQTLPQAVGIFSSKKIGYVLVFLFLMLSFAQYVWEAQKCLPDVLMAIVLFFSLKYTKKTQSNYYSSFWVEGIPILYVVLWKFLP
ncbi:hypothetical protein NBT05_08295 [Aquimarina sp. ERC-38]|uniref:hypothetical protein n=1 Tax=Aquimarina sp. ERC-38 TaxID=2949996 RepID=UPI0022468F22|nr:hypothetical protein [Aquimarina sp. ERC-38]UZO82461.1 hypothetical protein NBT05_08295 [Aquimarina sp. ERC-38]